MKFRVGLSILVSLAYFSLMFPVPPCTVVFLISLGFTSCSNVVSNYNALVEELLLPEVRNVRPDSSLSTLYVEDDSISLTQRRRSLSPTPPYSASPSSGRRVEPRRRSPAVSRSRSLSSKLKIVLERGARVAEILESAQPSFGRMVRN